MRGNVDLGLPGVSVPAGTHICGLFRGRAERNDMAGSFLREGLASGAKCLGVLDEPSTTAVTDAVDIDDPAAAGTSLEVRIARDAYTGESGFSGPAMLAYWEEWASDALTSGAYSTALLTGEMSMGIHKDIDPVEWVRYEGRLFVEIMRTHPMVLLGGTVLENMYYVDPSSVADRHG